MSSIRSKKQKIVADTAALVQSAKDYDTIVLAKFNEMNMSDMKKLRIIANQFQTKVCVIKPSLLRKAVADRFPQMNDLSKGQIMLLSSKDIASASVIKKFKNDKKLSAIGGITQGYVVNKEFIRSMANYESAKAVDARLLAALLAPYTRLMLTFKAIFDKESTNEDNQMNNQETTKENN